MKIINEKKSRVITDVVCDVCSSSTTPRGGSAQYGMLSAHWGYGSRHDGERYEIHLCETCFFATLASLRRQKMVEAGAYEELEDSASFGLLEQDNFFKD